MKIMVDEMPCFPSDCLFAEGWGDICHFTGEKCELNQDKYNPEYGTCPYLKKHTIP